MTTYYVGPGGNNSNNGQSWANRKLTINGAEDIPVAAGDTVYVAPGTYREQLTIDVSGTNGSPITYIGDTTGAFTDGIGGIVRITGSDNDTTTGTRSYGITASGKNYRTFSGFTFDMVGGYSVNLTSSCTDWTITDCFITFADGGTDGIFSSGNSQARLTVKRCIFLCATGLTYNAIDLSVTAKLDNHAGLVENCLFLLNNGGIGLTISQIGGITIKNCTFIGGTYAIYQPSNPNSGQTNAVNNCVFFQTGTEFNAASSNTMLVEDYNLIYPTANRTNVTAGSNDLVGHPLFAFPQLYSGHQLPPLAMYGPSSVSPHRAKAGSSQSSDDLFGITRPATNSKVSWGCIQYQPVSRETTTVHSGSASIKLADAGCIQLKTPVTNASTTFSVWVYRESDYAGTGPQLIVRQPGQADQSATDSGSTGQWNQLTITWTPAASPAWATIELRSNNTATSGSYATYFDDLDLA